MQSKATQDTFGDRLLATLRQYAPSRVLAYIGDDNAREISVPDRRKRWGQVLSAIEKLPWTRLELLDKKGALIATVDNTEPAREPMDLSTGGARDVTPHDVQMSRVLLDVMLRAQREVLSFRDAETTALLQAQGTVLREVTAAMSSLATIYQAQRDAAADVASLRTEAAAREAQGDGNIKELIEAAPQLLQMFGMLKGLLTSGDKPSPAKPSTPTNGVKG